MDNQHRFIFNDDFYNNLQDANEKLPPQKDPFAPVTEVKQAAVEVPKPEVKEEVKIDKIEIPKMEEIKTEQVVTQNVEPVYSNPQPLEQNKVEVPIQPVQQPFSQTVNVVPPVENNSNTLNVNTGIDTKLENEVLNNNKEEEKVEYVPIFEQPSERKIYKAARIKRDNMPTYDDIDEVKEVETLARPQVENNWTPPIQPRPVIIKEDVSLEVLEKSVVFKSNVLEEVAKKAQEENRFSILARYGEDFCSRDYVTNPAIGREEEIKALNLILLTPEKSALLVGKPGIGKTSIVEGLAYYIQRDDVPDALKGYSIISIKTASLLGKLPNGETKLQTLVDELKQLDKIILFIDEVHMLIEAQDDSNLDFANLFKESLGRGSIKMIGATTTEEYERYILRDKAFLRRFQRVDVLEPTKELTLDILMGTLPKIEKTTGATLKYSYYIKTEIMNFIIDITSEYKRVYAISSRYPDICLTLLNQAFSEAIFNNRKEVNIFDIRNAIVNSKNIYPDVIRKELVNFDNKFKDIIEEES